MRRLRYSTAMKAIVILLQEIFSIALVVSIVLVSAMLDKSMLDRRDLNSKDFTESQYYEELFQGAVDEILNFVEYQEQFETDGVYNPEKAVNIMAYRNSNGQGPSVDTSIGESNTFRYYLIDLENWSKEYAEQDYEVSTQLYMGQDGLLYQRQAVIMDGDKVRESDLPVETVGDMDRSLQELIVENAQYYYGGYYNLDEYPDHSGQSAQSGIFSDVLDTQAESGSADISDTQVESGSSHVSDTQVESGLADGTDTGAETGVTEGAPTSGEEPQVSDESTGNSGEEPPAVSIEEIVEKVRNGELFELRGQELIAMLTDLNLLNVQVFSEGQVLEEKYKTVDGTTILEEFLSEAITLTEMLQAYDSLEFTLENIGPEISAYKRMVNKYEKENTNLQFCVYVENENQTYSNMPEGIGWDDLRTYGENLGSYFYYNKNDIRLATNVGGMEDAFYEFFESENGGRNSLIFVGLDTDFPYQDSFYEAREEYLLLQPWSMFSLVASIISAFGSFLCFIYLSLAAGRNSEDDEVHLNWFDKIKTEILLAAFVGMFVGAVFVVRSMVALFGESDLIGMMIMAGGLAMTVVALFMIFYMSLIRRMKAGEMWTGSLLYWIGSGIHKVLRNWRPSVRILVLFSGHVIVTFIMAAMALNWWNSPTVLFLLFAAYLLLCGAEALMFLRQGVQRNILIKGIKCIASGDLEYKIDVDLLKGDNKVMGDAINTIGEGLYRAVDDSMKNERLKADLITNVSHDIKTPLTSIINYVDLLKRENLDNERVKGYIRVLDEKSQRLKQLTEDLVEASKVSSGNITLQMDRLNFVELVNQTAGEFNEKFEARGLTAVTRLPREPVVILADGRRIWRVIENLYNNVAKYAMENTRVYVDMEVANDLVAFSIKNISEQPLNIEASELTERFIRGDVSRSTEGSGLGLSIAQNLTKLMGGEFDIYLDGDLFKVTVTFPVAKDTEG